MLPKLNRKLRSKQNRLSQVVLLSVMLVMPVLAKAQAGSPSNPVSITASLIPADARAGEGAQVDVSFTIAAPYHLYALTQPTGPLGGPTITTLTLPASGPFASVGKPVEPAYETMYDSGFQINDQIYKNKVTFGIPVTLKAGISGLQKASVSVYYQVCTDQHCLVPATVSVPVTFTVAPGAARAGHLLPVSSIPPQAVAQSAGTVAPSGSAQVHVAADATATRIAHAQQAGILSFLLLAIGYGFLALLTPCVFPMIPITVSYFAKQKQENTRQGVIKAVVYCVGIISTFTIVGVVVAVLFRATGIRVLANNPVLNIGLAVLFIALGINLMGGYEIVLPGGLANTLNKGSQKAGLLGPYLMGLTFTLTSFTCTVAFVGTLLAAAAQGSLFYPIIGMLGFSTAFALPFFLLALFPQYLNRLPRSGAWMVTVKGFMGFVELAAALKFFSNADLVWGLGWLTRPVFLAVWGCIAVIAAFYLLGALRLPHDESRAIGWTRRGIGLVTLLTGIWFFAGINGMAMGRVGDFLPPTPYPGKTDKLAGQLSWGDDYNSALAKAAQRNEDILVNFTGVNCTNCRDMEQNVFPLAPVQAKMKHFVRLELFTDQDTPEDRANAKLQQKLTHTATLPVYAILSPNGTVLKIQQDRSSESKFLHFMDTKQSN